MVSSGRRDPTNGVALEDLSIGSTEDFISDGRGERANLAVTGHPDGTEKITGYRSRTRSSCGRDSEGHGFRISLKIGDHRVYEPYALMQLTTGIENSRRLKNHLSANRKLTLRTRTLFALALAASRARRRVGVLWGFGRNSGCRASGDHHTSTL
jgi:hypothetical protein